MVTLRAQGRILAYHDRSDGGLLAASQAVREGFTGELSGTDDARCWTGFDDLNRPFEHEASGVCLWGNCGSCS